MLIRKVLLFTAVEVRTEVLLDGAAARGICRREGVGTMRHLSAQVLWPQHLVKRGVATVEACSSAENRADLGTKPLSAHRLQQLECRGAGPKGKHDDWRQKRWPRRE